MKIKNCELEIIKGDITKLLVDVIVNPAAMGMDCNPDEHKIRLACASALTSADQLKVSTIAFPALGCGEGGFPLIGAAKIMAQEVLKFLKLNQKTSLTKIQFCLYDEEAYKIFFNTVTGYVTHFQDTLGDGPYVTTDIIIEMDGGIVLIERSNPPFGFALPGGFVDYGEELETAARREAKEETNLDLEDLRQFHVYSAPERDPRFHTVTLVFSAKGLGQLRAGDDAAAAKIVKFADLMKYEYAFDHKKVIKDYLNYRQRGDKL
ncbi:MAG: NUDIX domain-containing protein [Candidatus Omnitrophica bacterium]|nr:NUDIX domain-containing protein [Candidatus Omnitrophota bacterium]